MLSSNGVASFHSHSSTDCVIGDEGAIKLSEALKSNTSLTLLYLSSNILVASFSFSLNTGHEIDNEGAMKLAEALKSNSSLISLDLNSNKLVASFDSDSIQIILQR